GSGVASVAAFVEHAESSGEPLGESPGSSTGGGRKSPTPDPAPYAEERPEASGAGRRVERPRRPVAFEGPGTSTTVMPAEGPHTPAWQFRAMIAVVIAGLAILVLASVPVGPDWLSEAGAGPVMAASVWALADRSGGRPGVVPALALAVRAAIVVGDRPRPGTGRAVRSSTGAA